jgi:2-keto-3-deoxy-L-fuconate dehydrogenase
MLSGKTVLVTGAGQGIGMQTAQLALDRGATVVVLDRDEPLLRRSFAGKSTVIVSADVTDQHALTEHMEILSTIDCVVNAAAIVSEGNLTESSASDLRTALEVNVVGIHNVLAAVLPGMIRRQRGSIVNIASIVSSVKGLPNRYAYGTSKGAVIGLTKAVAADFIQQGIRCNAVCPGTVDSPSLRARADKTGESQKALAAYAARQPMGRLGRTEEIAPLICHLLSDESSFTTGGVFICDGGVCM